MPRRREGPQAHADGLLPSGLVTRPTHDPIPEGIQGDRDRISVNGPCRRGGRVRSPPRPAPAPHRAVRAVPPHPRREHARLDGGEDLRGEAVEADVGRAVSRRPVAVKLGGLRLREDVEAEAEVGLVSEARGAALVVSADKGRQLIRQLNRCCVKREK